MSRVAEIIGRILSKRPDLTREEVLALIEEKKREGRGLLSDEGAARLLAEELLVETEAEERARMRIQNLVAGLSDVTVMGRVFSVWPMREFKRKDGASGKVLRLVLADKTGRASCAIWGRHAEGLSRVGDLQGRLLKIAHGYTREGLSGQVEIHGGERSEVEVDPADANPDDYPLLEELFTEIGSITPSLREVNVIGLVEANPRISAFVREGREGLVLRTIIGDRSGSVTFVAWNERAEELKELRRGDLVKVINGRIRLDSSGFVEVHAEGRSQVTILKEAPSHFEPPVTRFLKISELRAGMRHVNLKVVALNVGDVREVARPTGEKVKVARLLVGDDTGLISLSLWRDKADLALRIDGGDFLAIEGARVRQRLGELSISVDREAAINVQPKGTEGIHIIQPKVTKIADVPSASGMVIVEGEVVDEPVGREVITGAGERVQVVSLRLRDETGWIRVTFWRQQAELAGRLRVGTRVRLVGLRIRPGLGGELELSSTRLTSIEILESGLERPSWQEIKQIIALKEGEESWVRAMVLEVGEDSNICAKCASCGRTLELRDGGLICASCGVKELAWQLSMKIRLDDGTGIISAAIDTSEPEALLGKHVEWAEREMLERQASRVKLPLEVTSKLMGTMVEALGVVQLDPKTGEKVLRIEKVIVLEQNP